MLLVTLTSAVDVAVEEANVTVIADTVSVLKEFCNVKTLEVVAEEPGEIVVDATSTPVPTER